MSLKKAFDRHGILIYPWYISDVVATKEIGKLTAGRTLKKAFMYVVKGFTTMYYDQESTEDLGRWLLARIVKDKKFYRLAINNIYAYSKELLNFCAFLEKVEISELSDYQLLQFYADYEKKLGQLRVWGWVPVILDGVFQPFLSDYIMEKFSQFLLKQGLEAETAGYYSLLSTSEKMSEVQGESLKRLQLLLGIKKKRLGKAVIDAIRQGKIANFKQKYPEVAKTMSSHLANFGWLTYAYTGPVMSFDYLFKTLRADLQNGDVAGQIKKIKDHFHTIKKQKTNLSRRLRLPQEINYFFTVSSELMFIKDYRKGIYQKSYVAMDKVMTELARRLGIAPRDIRNLVYNEIKAALIGGQKRIYQQKARQRTQLACYTVSQGKIKVAEGGEAKRLIAAVKKNERMPVIKVKELKGSVAYAGLARGRAKIILTKEDVPKLKAGEILISSATNPDLISAMKKAAAFVTDTGGIICHAAIVARELKKPCVIGTKIATQVLKDGDEVEVDARQGIVRLIKK